MRSVGNDVVDVLVYPITIESPNAHDVAEQARSLEIAPFRNEKDVLLTLPCWAIVPPTLISYHLTIEPAPPAIVWTVQMVVVLKRESKPATAWVSRPSRVSSLFDVPLCGADGGTMNVVTLILVGADTAGVPPLFVMVNSVRKFPVLPHGFAVHSTSALPMT